MSNLSMNKQAKQVEKYYQRLGSRLGYILVMKRSQHFGYYDDEHTTEEDAQDNFHRRFTDKLDLKSGMRVLDAGCGQGVVAMHIAGNHNVTITGVTIVERETRGAKRLAERNGVSGKTVFMVADYHRLPFEDNTFDRVYTIESLSHAYDLPEVISELYRVLKPGGKIVCAEYEFDIRKLEQLDFNPVEYVEKRAAIHGIRQFDKGNFKQLLKKAGFTSMKADDWTKPLYPSFSRLRRLARYPAKLVTGLRLQWLFPNVIAAAMYADGVDKGNFKFEVYNAQKGAKQ